MAKINFCPHLVNFIFLTYSLSMVSPYSTWHNPFLFYVVNMFHVSFTKHKKWLRETTLCGQTQASFKWLKCNFFPHLVNFVFLTSDVCTLCLLVDFQSILSMMTPYVCYVFVKRLCNNLPLYTTSPGLPYFFQCYL